MRVSLWPCVWVPHSGSYSKSKLDTVSAGTRHLSGTASNESYHRCGKPELAFLVQKKCDTSKLCIVHAQSLLALAQLGLLVSCTGHGVMLVVCSDLCVRAGDCDSIRSGHQSPCDLWIAASQYGFGVSPRIFLVSCDGR